MHSDAARVNRPSEQLIDCAFRAPDPLRSRSLDQGNDSLWAKLYPGAASAQAPAPSAKP